MPGLTTPQMLLPRRFVINPGVASPLICRHPKPLRCTCHAEAAAAAAPPGGSPAYVNPPSATPKSNAKLDPEVRKLDLFYQKLIAQIVFAIRAFPEAVAAVQEILMSGQDPGPAPSYGPSYSHG